MRDRIIKIGIAGCGGIGSNVARILAQAKTTYLRIVDFDRIEASNLNRQFYSRSQIGELKTDMLEKNLVNIFPEIIIEKQTLMITKENAFNTFKDCDIIVEAFDMKELKKMLIEEFSASGKFMVSASGIAGHDMDGVNTKKIGNCHIVGDLTSDQSCNDLFPPKIMMVASIMAGLILNHAKEMQKKWMRQE